jgi:hypothetical protein
MNILLTFDYELYFGDFTGSQQKCIISPVNELIRIAEKHDVRFSFFIDCGYIVKMEQYMHQHTHLKDDYQKLTEQLKYLSAKGHDVQLHIHPHWEDTVYDGKKWIMDTSRYRLQQFTIAEVEKIFSVYSQALIKITDQPLHTYRAGGWCIQPFERLAGALKKTGIRADSSVFKEGYADSFHYYYDFRNCPPEETWLFEEDPARKNNEGTFLEIPISSMRVSPLFYWKLYLLGRINPGYHKPIGDGRPILSKGYKKRILSRYTRQVISTDGYNAKLLQKQTLDHQKRKASLMVILGHPKALSPFSIDALDKYLSDNKNLHRFITYSGLLHELKSSHI